MPRLFGHCPNCEERIKFKRLPNLGQVVFCRGCRQALQVFHRNPVKLDWAEDTPNNYRMIDSSRQKSHSK